MFGPAFYGLQQKSLLHALLPSDGQIAGFRLHVLIGAIAMRATMTIGLVDIHAKEVRSKANDRMQYRRSRSGSRMVARIYSRNTHLKNNGLNMTNGFIFGAAWMYAVMWLSIRAERMRKAVERM